MNRYKHTEKFIIDKLQAGLPGTLYYHGLHHILDVLQAAVMLGEKEKVSDQEMEVLKIAVLFHDAGFMISPKDHEKIGCNMVKDLLPALGYSDKEIAMICGMIMVTKYPHHPATLLEEIICDADLDYLGRDDFFTIGNTLYRELNRYGTVANEQEWNQLQEKFLSSHTYFTKTAKELRDAKKKEHLNQIRELVKSD